MRQIAASGRLARDFAGQWRFQSTARFSTRTGGLTPWNPHHRPNPIPRRLDRRAVPEHQEGATLGRHGMVVEEAANDLLQPLPLFRDWESTEAVFQQRQHASVVVTLSLETQTSRAERVG